MQSPDMTLLPQVIDYATDAIHKDLKCTNERLLFVQSYKFSATCRHTPPTSKTPIDIQINRGYNYVSGYESH